MKKIFILKKGVCLGLGLLSLVGASIPMVAHATEESNSDIAFISADNEENRSSWKDFIPDECFGNELELPKDGDERNLNVGWTNGELGFYYCKDSNLIKVNGWQQINEAWYHFSDYVLDSGWLNDNGTWYFLKDNVTVKNGRGQMQTGWLNDGGTWYYLQSNGAMMSNGWLQINNVWYYFYSSGAMAVNTTIDGYYLNSSGAWIK